MMLDQPKLHQTALGIIQIAFISARSKSNFALVLFRV
jgi:hypothetical protein